MAALPNVGRADTDVSSRTTHQLYEQYGRQIYAYCLQRLRSREEGEDAVQTTFLNAFRALQKGTETQFEQAWLYKIAQHVCLERSLSSGRRLQVESPTDLHVIQEVATAHAPEDSEQLIGVEDALAGMPATQRDAIVMREWQGLSYREIGAELGLSQSAVETLIFRARRSLAEALEHPQPARKKLSGGRMLNIGSFVTAIKTLLTGGTAVKMVAVAVTAGAVAVAGEKSAERALSSHAHRLAPRSAHVQQAPTRDAAVTGLAPAQTAGRHPAPVKSRHARASARGAMTLLPPRGRQASHSRAKAMPIDDPATGQTTAPPSAPPPPATPEPATPAVVAAPTAAIVPAVAPASAPAPPPKQTPAPAPGTGNGSGGTPAPQTGGDKGSGGTNGSNNGKDAGNGKTKGKGKDKGNGNGHGKGKQASSTSTGDPTPAAAPVPPPTPDPSPSHDPAQPAPSTGEPTSGSSSPGTTTTTTPATRPATPAGGNDPGQGSGGNGHGHDGGGNGQGGGDGGHGHGHGK